MKTVLPAPSFLRRALACSGFAVCWLGAAVTGFQANVGVDPGRGLQVERPNEAGEASLEPPEETPRTQVAGEPRVLSHEAQR